LNWEVHHYWLRIQDPDLNTDEWVQFVVNPSAASCFRCTVMVRHNSNGTPGPILSTWKGTLAQGRTLWEYYIKNHMGVEVSDMREIRQGLVGVDDMSRYNPLDRLDA